MKAVVCPVCNGVGQVSGGFYTGGGDLPYYTTADIYYEMCRSCKGAGYLWTKEDKCPVCGQDKMELRGK